MIQNNPWRLQGLSYVVTLRYAGRTRGTLTRKLDFISYHLIRLIHGEDKLIEMATAPPREDW